MFWGLILDIIERYWKWIAMFLMAVCIWWLWSQWRSAETDRKREKQNVEESLREHSEVVKQLELDRDVFKKRLEDKYSTLIDSLKNVRPKEVTKIHYVEVVKNIIDTTEILRVKHDTIYMNKAHYSDGCGLSVTTSWREGAKTATFDVKDTSKLGIVTYKEVRPWKRVISLGFIKQKYNVSVVNQTCQTVIYNEQITNIKAIKKK